MSNVVPAVTAPSVLVVDDDDAIRTLIKRVLTRDGCLVTEATDGAVAIERLEARRFDAVVLDLMMPRVNGFEVLTYMRERLDGRQCVIVVSAAADRRIAAADQSLVMTTLHKPFELEALMAAVHKCTRV